MYRRILSSFAIMKQLFVFLFLAAACSGAPLDQDFGYVDVRPGAHMFWVTYHTEASNDWTQAPLIMWLQGGPGSSGVGYGNFEELGPYDINGNKRPYAWTTVANVMFVDNPVGTGYSYVDNDDTSLMCSDNACIANDLVTMLTSVFNQYPEMQQMEFFVYAESYGGKMTADFALALIDAMNNGLINCNFKGVALGDSWISPMDSINTWGDYLYHMGFVNAEGQANIDASAAHCQSAVDEENWTGATVRWSATEGVVSRETEGVNFYNVLAEEDIYDSQLSSKKQYYFMKPHIRNLYDIHVRPQQRDELQDFMNGPQKVVWNIPDEVTYDSQGGLVFNHLAGDFMKPVISSVESLLDNTTIHVAVYTGDLDLICDTPGTYRWIENMNYNLKTGFNAASRQALYITAYSSMAAYVQRYQRFSVHTILRSGHMVPVDAPEMCIEMINMITAYGEEAVPTLKKTVPVIKQEEHTVVEKVEKKTPVKIKKVEKKAPVKVEKKAPVKVEKAEKKAPAVKVEKKEHQSIKAPKVKVQYQKPSQRLLDPNYKHPIKGKNERELKAMISQVRQNNATPVGRKFNTGTIFRPVKPDLNI